MDRYWISSSTSNFNNTANWSNTSGGSGGYSVPGTDSTAHYDGNGIGSCYFDIPVNVAGLQLLSGYTGTVDQSGLYTSINGSSSFNAGTFYGNYANIQCSGPLTLNGGTLIGTDGTLSILSSFTRTSGTFTANNGIVSLDASGAYISVASDSSFSTLQCNAVDARINGYISVLNLVLTSGSLGKISDATVYAKANVYCAPDYNSWGLDNNIPMIMDGTGLQKIYNTSGGVLPSLFINKEDTTQVVCEGTGPLQVRGDFCIKDGTFNSNGLDIWVGLRNFSDKSRAIFV